MFGKCKVCLEKDSRIADLKSEITELRKVVFVSQSATALPIINLEANKILNGDTEITEVDPSEIEENIKVAEEADKIFNAAY